MTDQLVQRNIEINGLYQQQLQETAHRDAVLASISDAVIVQDPSGRVILRNLTADSLIRTIARNATTRKDFTDLCRRPTDLAEPRTVTFVDQVFSVLATPVCLESGDLLGYVIVFRDITALAEAERLKDELIQQMSHELRTPLTAARGYVDLIKALDGANISEQGKTFIMGATESLSTLARMVEQVIGISTMVSNQFTLQFEVFNLAQLLSDEVALWSPTIEERELSISLYLSSNTLNVEADEHWLLQVIDHVLRNACSYTLPGGSIQVHGTSTRTRAIIWVVDTGVGIDDDEIDRVFDRMYRGRSAEAGPTDARGLGLGLYVAKRIVEAHHGTIALQSQPGHGTTVTIEMPLRQRSH
jgi:two-component system phosphate regulon sensor histidine kinase PhoR